MVQDSLKIGLVLDTSLDSTDGVPQYVVHLGEWLRGQGHDVHYLVGQTKRQDLPNLHSLSRNISVNFNGNRTTIPVFAGRRKIRQALSGRPFDVLHVQTPHHPFMAQPVVLAAARSTAIIGTFHVLPYGSLSRIGSKVLGFSLRPSLKKFDKMLAVSSVAAEFCSRSFGLNATVVPNMIDYQKFSSAKPLERYDDEVKTILFLGRLVERKGCRTLLEAVALLRRQPDLTKFRVVICGRGAQEEQLRRFVQQQSLDSQVEFAGYVSEDDKPRYYASADLSVFPSSAGESFGIVLLEAMASGRATVLAGDNPGYHSVMEPRPELLFDPASSKELAQKLAFYLKNDASHAQTAAWGGRYAVQFDITVVGQQIVEHYTQALRKRRRP